MTLVRVRTNQAITGNVINRGHGRIYGIVKAGASPWRRRVRLFNVRDTRLVGEMWSDAETGAYEFSRLDESQRYFVVAHDHTGVYNAVIADNVTPEPMP